MKKYLFLLVAFMLQFAAQSQTVGLVQRGDSTLLNGYFLFAPISSTTTYLIDRCGKKVKTWNSIHKPGMSVYLTPSGNLLRAGFAGNVIFTAGGNGGIIEKIDWTNKVIWTYRISDSLKCQHHDIKELPNGNVLVIAWESKTLGEAIDKGRDPSKSSPIIWSEQILEIKPIGKDSGTVVWEWHLWDHMVQGFDPLKTNFGLIPSNPQLFDINYAAISGMTDWLHFNSIDYNEELDQILVSVLNTNEIWIIDHSTTKAQAASHSGGKAGKGGDLLYRWGNPLTYGRGTSSDQKLFGQHNARWIEKGYPLSNQIMVFNNGAGRSGGVDSNYSTVEIINPPLVGFSYATTSLPFLPNVATWTYNKGNIHSYFASYISGAQPLSNGNVLLCHGPLGAFAEVKPTGNQVWEYINPVTNVGIANQYTTPKANEVFRCTFYPPSYSGFVGHTLTSGNILENVNPLSDSCGIKIVSVAQSTIVAKITLSPNPASEKITIQLPAANAANGKLEIINNLGQLVITKVIRSNTNALDIPTAILPNGLYFVKVQLEGIYWIEKIMIQH